MYLLWELFYVFVLPIIMVCLFNTSLLRLIFDKEKLTEKSKIVYKVIFVISGLFVGIMVFSFVSITGVFIYDMWKYWF